MKLPIWKPSQERKNKANMTKFIDLVNKRYKQKINSYNELHKWSINNLRDFWGSMWEFADIKASNSYDTIMTTAEGMMDTKWFHGARLNFAENLLRYRDNQTALIFKGEAQQVVRMTYAELYDQVARLAKSLRKSGVRTGDRVVGFMPNMMETVIAMLASASIGGIWSSCSPDFGIKGILDRFAQTEPKVLFTANGYSYHGKVFDSLERAASITGEIPSIQKVVVIPYTEKRADISHIPNSIHYEDFLSREAGLEIQFEQLPPDHPLYIMYTSGTTGLPKCMIQGIAGVLINQLKELKLHTDLKREDTIFYFTTCGWMMWNWLISSLALGATVLLYDGSAFYPDAEVLWKLAQDEKVTIFGTSARYLAEVEKRGVAPGEKYDLSNLRTILSTGSTLPAESFEFVYRDIKKDVLLSSISGGSDINGCFLTGNPISPVYAGELQCLGLGMNVQAFDSSGVPVFNQKGELVCTTPSPSMPLYFWNDENNQKYHDAYFNVFPNVWHHGDYIEITDTGAVVYGRSDATLNPGGVRIGTAEIYRQVETIAEVEDSVVVGQNWENDVRVILFVKLAKGVELTKDLIGKIRTTIRKNASPRHTPARVIAIDDIPYTLNMKKVELAVRNVIHNEPVMNADALANPESLKLYENLKELQS
ncbi:MAG: Acetyl-coenzyme A synthetase [Syntrophomonadaceae bacterium]|nr:Acetyl-coenzyme A synthetase [Bacillota bacterium]